MSKISCPVCGSEEVKRIIEKASVPITLGQPVEYHKVQYKCENCEQVGDFTDENKKLLEDAIILAEKDLQKNLIESLGERGYTMAYIERALELPQRTLFRWKTEYSGASLALLRIIHSMPFVIEIAEARYEHKTMFKTLANVVLNAVASIADTSGKTLSEPKIETVSTSGDFSVKWDVKDKDRMTGLKLVSTGT